MRTTPRMLMLYFTAGIPAFAQLRSICCICSICRSRSGLCPSITAAIGALPITDEGSGSGTISSAMPCFPTRSRRRDNPSTDHAASSVGERSALQI
jgi:hypothetical protein